MQNGIYAGTRASKKPGSASAISSRSGAPERITPTIVNDVCVWPRARNCCTGTPAFSKASA